tara:strand:- start:181 stop:573 length:393 start_codon:yes stop_codon:yes gene_type:complete
MDYVKLLDNTLSPLPNEMVQVGLQRLSESQDDDFSQFNLANDKSGVRICISISKKNGSMTTFIEKDGKQSWHLEEYFKQKRSKSEYNNLFFKKSPEEYIRNLCQIIESDLKEVIQGNIWLDIERDWMGYK